MTDSFRDFTYHAHIEFQHVRVGARLVTLRRDGEKQMGPAGRVELRYFCGGDLEPLYPSTMCREPLLEYTGTLEQAQGYAQGIVDIMSISDG